jgi:hypothetical protein
MPSVPYRVSPYSLCAPVARVRPAPASRPHLDLAPPPLATSRFELRKNIPVALMLTNTSNERVAFKVKTTSPKKYCVRPSSGFVEPGASREVQVIMQQQKEAPLNYNDCKDKFLVQSSKAAADAKEVSPEMFELGKARDLKQIKLRVVLVPPAKPPSPVPEGSESEPTSHSPGSAAAPATATAFMSTPVASGEEEMRRRIQAMERRPAPAPKAAREAVATAPTRSHVGFSLLQMVLVALLAFVLGHLTQVSMPLLTPKVEELLKKFQ